MYINNRAVQVLAQEGDEVVLAYMPDGATEPRIVRCPADVIETYALEHDSSTPLTTLDEVMPPSYTTAARLPPIITSRTLSPTVDVSAGPSPTNRSPSHQNSKSTRSSTHSSNSCRVTEVDSTPYIGAAPEGDGACARRLLYGRRQRTSNGNNNALLDAQHSTPCSYQEIPVDASRTNSEGILPIGNGSAHQLRSLACVTYAVPAAPDRPAGAPSGYSWGAYNGYDLQLSRIPNGRSPGVEI